MAQKLGNARLAVPKVNQNPRVVGNGMVAPRKKALANRRAAPAGGSIATGRSLATSTAQATNAATPSTQSAPTDPFQSAAAPAAPAGPPGLFDLPSYTPQNGQDPRDATYWANVAKLKFSSEQEYSRNLLEQTRADTDYGVAAQAAIRNRAIQQRGLGEDSMRGNLGASGWLNRNEAEQTTNYTEDRAAAARGKEREDQDRTAAQKAILQSFGLDAASLLGEAGGRYAESTALRAQNEEPLVGIEAAPAAAGAPAPRIGIAPAKALKPKPKKTAIANRRKA